MDYVSGLLGSFAQGITYTTTTVTSTKSTGVPVGLLLFYLLIAVISIVSFWVIFKKAGKPGWASIVPIYNIIVELQIVGRPLWWILLLFVPIVNIVVAIIVILDLAKAFGKGTGFGVLMLLFPYIAYPILAFGKSTYIGVNATATPATQAPADTPVSSTTEKPAPPTVQ